MREQAFLFLCFFTPIRHLVLIMEKSYWFGLKPRPPSSCTNNGCILSPASSWVRHTKIHTQSACTLAPLLMLMPRSILLSSCKQTQGRAAALHFNTLTEPWPKLLIQPPEWKTNDTQRTAQAANKPLQRPLFSSLYFLLSQLDPKVASSIKKTKPVSMIPTVPAGKGQPA